MLTHIEAVYEGGILRPLQPVDLQESEHVTLTIVSGTEEKSSRDFSVLEMARTATAGLKKIPSIEEVRAALAIVLGSLSADLLADRGDD
jgi:predicted DNA-binding antitoxin AbrB/MazE fold protein